MERPSTERPIMEQPAMEWPIPETASGRVNVTIQRSLTRSFRQEASVGKNRVLQNVPIPVVETMIQDFQASRWSSNGRDRGKLYQYDQDGGEVVVTINFSKVISLEVSYFKQVTCLQIS